jgi:replicative DNA helicase
MIKNSSEVIDSAVRQLADYYTGKVQPLSSGIDWLDDILLGGFRNTILTIAAPPYHGKTYLAETIMANMKAKYKEDVVFVDCWWEMTALKILTRALSKATGQSEREVYTKKPDAATLAKYKEVLADFRAAGRYVQPEPVTYEQFYEDLREVVVKHPNQAIGVVIDNLENLLLTTNNQKWEMDMLIQRINLLNKSHSRIFFIMLTQTNRELEDRSDNPLNSFPKERDLYATSSVFKLSDAVVVKYIPYRFGAMAHGVFSTDRYKYVDDSFKKPVRNGAKTTSFLTPGNVFYHVIKSRGMEEEYDVKNVFVDKMFDVPQSETKIEGGLEY